MLKKRRMVLTDSQLEALTGLIDGTWKFTADIKSWRSLPSLRRHGLVELCMMEKQWRITPEGFVVCSELRG